MLLYVYYLLNIICIQKAKFVYDFDCYRFKHKYVHCNNFIQTCLQYKITVIYLYENRQTI